MARYLGQAGGLFKGTTRECALQYAEFGWSVYPAAENKKPRISGGFNAATNDSDRVSHLFDKFPAANVGIATGLSGLVVLDIDPRNSGDSSLSDLVRRIGFDSFEGAPTVQTPSGGEHVYFRAPAGSSFKSTAGVLGRGLDIRAQGGGVIAPTSRRDGGYWSWKLPPETPLDVPLLPASLGRLLNTKRARPSLGLQGNRIVDIGSRTLTLTSEAGKLRFHFGLDEETIFEILQTLNVRRCRVPLPDRDLRKIATSITRYPAPVDPLLWLSALSPRLSKNEHRLALFYARHAGNVCGPFTPREATIMKQTDLGRSALYEARCGLEDKGAIRIVGRGLREPPEIVLLTRLESGNPGCGNPGHL